MNESELKAASVELREILEAAIKLFESKKIKSFADSSCGIERAGS